MVSVRTSADPAHARIPETPAGGTVVQLNGTSRGPGRRPLPELERRERERGDREPGLAALQFDQVHAHGTHDLDVDTSLASPKELALRIRDFLPLRPRPTAFEQLRRTLRAPEETS